MKVHGNILINMDIHNTILKVTKLEKMKQTDALYREEREAYSIHLPNESIKNHRTIDACIICKDLVFMFNRIPEYLYL